MRLLARRADLDEESLERLAPEFGKRRCLRFKDWLDPRLARQAAALAQELPFRRDELGATGSREICDEPRLRGLLMLLFQREPLFRYLERLSGKSPIHAFEGTIYRLTPNSGQCLDWHDDEPGTRKLALSLGLSQDPYSGGEFQIRRKTESQVLAREPSLSLGEALLFDVDPLLEHRVTTVQGDAPRTVFAGWFLPFPSPSLQGKK